MLVFFDRTSFQKVYEIEVTNAVSSSRTFTSQQASCARSRWVQTGPEYSIRLGDLEYSKLLRIFKPLSSLRMLHFTQKYVPEYEYSPQLYVLEYSVQLYGQEY